MVDYKITKVDERNRTALLTYLKNDSVRHAFALYDLLREPENTTFFLATDDVGVVIGYLLIYRGLRYLSIILDSSTETAEELLRHAPSEKGILFIPRNLLSVVKANVGSTGIYIEDQMSVARERTKLFPSRVARRLTADDATGLAELYSSEDVRGSRDTDVDAVKRWIERSPFFGIEANGKLVAVAGTLAIVPEVSVIGGVYTHPLFRGKGFAKTVTSAVARHLFGVSNVVTLYVRSDNRAAISAYRTLGFEKKGERFWVDMGTGLQP